jgi:hypothetical protein
MVRQMQTLVDQSFADPIVRQKAVDIVRYVTPRDYVAMARAIRQWLSDHVRFLRDFDGKELSYTPRLMIKAIGDYGITNVDCDDAAVLAASLGRSVGLRARFALLGFIKPDAPLSHVFTELAGPASTAPWVEQDVTRAQREIPAEMVSRRVLVTANLPPKTTNPLAAFFARSPLGEFMR